MTQWEFEQWVKMAKGRSLKLEGAPFVIRPEKMLKLIGHIERLIELDRRSKRA